jgi:hypothetical protein
MNEFHLILSNPHYVCRLRVNGQPALERVRKSIHPLTCKLTSIFKDLDIALFPRTMEACSTSSLMQVLARRAKNRQFSDVRIDITGTCESSTVKPVVPEIKYFDGPAPPPSEPNPSDQKYPSLFMYRFVFTVSVHRDSKIKVPSIITDVFPPASTIVASAVLTTHSALDLKMIANESDLSVVMSQYLVKKPSEKSAVHPAYPLHIAEQAEFVKVATANQSGIKHKTSPLAANIDELASVLTGIKYLESVQLSNLNMAEPERSKFLKQKLQYYIFGMWRETLSCVINSLETEKLVNLYTRKQEGKSDDTVHKSLGYKSPGKIERKINDFNYLEVYVKLRQFCLISHILVPLFKELFSLFYTPPDPDAKDSQQGLISEYLTTGKIKDSLRTEVALKLATLGSTLYAGDLTPSNMFEKIHWLVDSLPSNYDIILGHHTSFSPLEKVAQVPVDSLSLLRLELKIPSKKISAQEYINSLIKCSIGSMHDIHSLVNKITTAVFFGNICTESHSIRNYRMITTPHFPNFLYTTSSSNGAVSTTVNRRYNVVIDDGIYLYWDYYHVMLCARGQNSQECDKLKLPGSTCMKEIVHVERVWSNSENNLAFGGLLRIYLSQFGKFAKPITFAASSSTLYVIEIRKYPPLSKEHLEALKKSNSMIDNPPEAKKFLIKETPSAVYLAKTSHSHTPVVPFKMGSYGVAEHPSSGTALVFATNGQQHGFAKIPVSKPSPYKSPASEPLFTTLSPTLQLAPVKLEIPKAAKNSADGQFMQKLKRNTHIESISINSRSVLVVTTTEIARSDIQRPMLVYSLDLAEMNNVVYNPALLNFRNSVSAKTFCVNDRLFAIVLHTRPPAYTIVSLSLNGKNIQACGKIAVKVTMPRCVTETMDWDEAQNCLAVWGLYHGKQSTELSLVLRTYKLVV